MMNRDDFEELFRHQMDEQTDELMEQPMFDIEHHQMLLEKLRTDESIPTMMKTVATYVRMFHDTLTSQGFTDDQAFEMSKVIFYELTGGAM